jgi:hypothetical protein
MKARKSSLFAWCWSLLLVWLLPAQGVAGELDHVSLVDDTLDSARPLRVQRFSIDNTDLGKPKHKDTARVVLESADDMLLVDIVEELRDAGFADVAEYDADEAIDGAHYVLTGEFTELNPGSQSSRVIWGFGAGKSRVCVSGKVSHDSGATAGSFRTCAKSLGWGSSEEQLDSQVDRIGVSLGQFLADWAR